MKILLSAYSFRPYAGSEPGVGWNYATELANLGHEVWVLTRQRNQKEIEQVTVPPNLHFVYDNLPGWIHKLYKTASVSEHIFYFFWQMNIFFTAKRFLKEQDIDLIHHITLGVFRTPVFLGLLKKPFVFGPVGGGENYSLRLKKKLPFKFFMVEMARDFVNFLFSVNPLYQHTLSRSKLILCRTQDTLKYIPKSLHPRCVIDMGIGHHSASYEKQPQEAKSEKKRIRLLYAGRPLYWKGIHMVIKSFKALKERGIDVSLTVVGSGDPSWARQQAVREGIHNSIHWLGKVSMEKLYQLYRESDFLVFPSLREAGGMVAIEALSFGLPVVCLDLGGPCEIVNTSCACIVPTKHRQEEEVVRAIADAIEEVIQSGRLPAMKEAAYLEAEQYAWEKVVRKTYSHITRHLYISERKEKELV